MPSRSLDLIVNLQQNTLVSAFSSAVQARLPSFVFGDTTPISIRFVEPADTDFRPWREIPITDSLVSVGIGLPGGRATSGTYTISYDGAASTPLPHNAESKEVSLAINAIPTVEAAGGVTVSGERGVFRVTFLVAGEREKLTGDASGLSPSSEFYVSEIAIGSEEDRSIQLVKAENKAAAYAELTTPLPPANINITTTREGIGGLSDIKTLELSPRPYDGSYTLLLGANETESIPYDASPSDIKTALESITEEGKISVFGDFPIYTIAFDASLNPLPDLVGDPSALIVPTGRSGVLSTNTMEIEELLGANGRADALFEVQITDLTTGDAWTPLQVPCRLSEDIIANTPPSPSEGQSYLSEEQSDARYVKFSEEQELTLAQQEQARDNIGAIADPTEEIERAIVDIDEITIFPEGDKTQRKTSLMSRFWTYIAAKIDEGRTYSGDHVFAGQLSATSQTLDLGSKVISRDSLMEFMGSMNFFWWREEYLTWSDWSNDSTGTGVPVVNYSLGVTGIARLLTGIDINSVAEVVLARGGNMSPSEMTPYLWRDRSAIVESIADVKVRIGFSNTVGLPMGASGAFTGFEYDSAASPNWRFYDSANNAYTDTGVLAVADQFVTFTMRNGASLNSILWSINGGPETIRLSAVNYFQAPVNMITNYAASNKTLIKDFTSLTGYPTR